MIKDRHEATRRANLSLTRAERLGWLGDTIEYYCVAFFDPGSQTPEGRLQYQGENEGPNGYADSANALVGDLVCSHAKRWGR